MSRARTLSAWSPRALITITEGRRRPSSVERTCQPSTKGKPMSSSTTSKAFSLSAWTPAEPSAANSTSYPPDCSAETSTPRRARSSSTTRMRDVMARLLGRQDVEAWRIDDLAIRSGEHPAEFQPSHGREPVLDLLGPDKRNLGLLGDRAAVRKRVIDLEARPVSVERVDPHARARARPQPVRIGQLEGECPIGGNVDGGRAQPVGRTQDARRHDDEVELPAKVEVFDPGSDERRAGKARS